MPTTEELTKTIENLKALCAEQEARLESTNKALEQKERQLLVAKTEVETIKYMLTFCFSETKPA
jgi:hypothetical protein